MGQNVLFSDAPLGAIPILTMERFILFQTEERSLWIKALPNIIQEYKISDWMGVCDLHWPTNN